MTSHFPDHAFIVSDQVGIMKKGAFSMIGPAEEVITSDTLKATYHVEVRVEFIEIAGRKVCIPIRYRPGSHTPAESVIDQLIRRFADSEQRCPNCGLVTESESILLS
jgi:iron complex transport system ATP-binding protein